MQQLKAFKFELMPTGEQRRQMSCFAGCCRFVYNKALALQNENHKAGNAFISYVDMTAKLPVWKRDAEIGWLKDAPAQSLQQALKDLERAFKNFFEKRSDYPRFKRKGTRDGFRFPEPKQIKLEQANNRVQLPKLGWLRYRNSRQVIGEIRHVTVSRSGDKWFMSIQTRIDIPEPQHPSASIIGIDLGIARFATLSDDTHIEPLHSFKKHQRRLARYQRRLARKVKFSNNWKKAKAKVTKIHTKIANARNDFLHQTSTSISKNHAIVCLEDLNVSNMSATAKGTHERPGRNVKQKSGLNRSILDQGWFEYRRQLEYKQIWMGGRVIVVPPHHTSQTCPACQCVSSNNRITQSQFKCINCGYENHADVVGAINVLERGHRLLACGETMQSGRSTKQEPTEATQAAFAA